MYKTISKSFALIFIALLFSAPRAQTAPPQTPATEAKEDRVALYQALLDLTSPWTVMCIAAHPDDEDGTSLIVLRHKYGVHTVSLFSTFGEGGQNAIGPELYEEMGAMRARETLAAAEIQGSEPHFLGLKDFGFSKSADEAFRFWGHDEALRRMVLQIRKLRPDVIITNHDTTSGHGHHQATGRLELEAFDAAADANRFPEQLKDGVTTWQVQRLFVRGGFGGNANRAQPPDNTGVVTIDPNERDTIRGTTFAEQALSALQKHATQGPWPKTVADMARFRNSLDGKLPLIRYRLTREAKDVAPLPESSHSFLNGLRVPEEVTSRLALLKIEGRLLTEFVDQRDKVLAALVRARKASEFSGILRRQSFSMVKGPRDLDLPANTSPRTIAALQLLFEHFNLALAEASGLKAELRFADGGLIVPSEQEHLLLRISNNGADRVWLEEATFHYSFPLPIQLGGVKVSRPLSPGESKSLTMPTVHDLTGLLSNDLWNLPSAGAPLVFEKGAITLDILVNSVPVSVPISSQLTLLPTVEITDIAPKTFVLTPGNASRKATFSMRLINHRNHQFSGRITGYLLRPCPGTSCSRVVLASQSASLKPNETRLITIDLPARPTGVRETGVTSQMTLSLPYEAWFYAEEQAASSSPLWIPLGKSSYVVIGVADARVSPNLRVGYLRGFDFSLPNALAALGVESKELSVDEVKTADLQKYSTIIIDNRVYESQPELIAVNQRLLDYAKDGGTLIVFYHKSNEWNPDSRRNRPQLAPYPITLNDERITDENAPVTFTEPEHPLLNSPNKIGQEDFVGWIQERGLYYPKDWDAHYHALLSTNDPGEKPLRGGLLVADYGRGHYIYTSMVWYRQLRAGVPGGYRMLANMISYGHQ